MIAVITKAPRFVPEKTNSEEAKLLIKCEYGDLYLVVYNKHNGYYPHNIVASWEKHRLEDSL